MTLDLDHLLSLDNVLLEHGGLPHILPLAVHLDFFAEQVRGVILSHFYSLSFLIRDLIVSWGWVGWQWWPMRF